MVAAVVIQTDLGRDKLAKLAAKGETLKLAQFAVGDASDIPYVPTGKETKLVNERYRNDISHIDKDDISLATLKIENIVPSTTGGYVIREIGLFDEDNDLIAIGSCEINKPDPAIVPYTSKITILLSIDNAESVEFKINIEGYVTHDYAIKNFQSIKFKQDSDSSVERMLIDKVRETVSVKDFGAVGDGINDDTDAIQKAIDFLSPYEFQEFKNSGGTSRQTGGKLFFPRGTYRITKTILLAPNIVLIGANSARSNLSFMSAHNYCSVILADADINGFVLDSAPFNASGIREVNTIGSFVRFDSDDLECTGGVGIHDIRIDTTKNVYGGINLVNCLSANISNVAIRNTAIPMRVSSSWDFKIADNLFVPRCIGLALIDVTSGYVARNHLTRTGEMQEYPDFNYSKYSFSTDVEYQNSPRAIHVSVGDVRIVKNIIEGKYKTGIMVTYNMGNAIVDNYMEAITGACYASQATSLYVVVGYTACRDAVLWHGHVYNYPYQGVTLDWSNVPANHTYNKETNRLLIADICSPSSSGSGNNLVLIPSSYYFNGNWNNLISRVRLDNSHKKITLTSEDNEDNNLGVSNPDNSDNNTVTMYVSSTGDDKSFGLTFEKPMLTIEGALTRASYYNCTDICIIIQKSETVNLAASSFNCRSIGSVNISSADFKKSGATANAVINQNLAKMNILQNNQHSFNMTVAAVDIACQDGWLAVFRPTNLMLISSTISINSAFVQMGKRVLMNLNLLSCTLLSPTDKAVKLIDGTIAPIILTADNCGGSTLVKKGIGDFIISDIN